MTRPKDVGTRAETLIVRHARLNGFPGADRLTLTGNRDRCDIGLCPGVVIEAKSGAAAERASDMRIHEWLIETETGRVNAGADIALLVTKRAGHGPARVGSWWTHTRLGPIAPSLGHSRACNCIYCTTTVRLTLDRALAVLRYHGYGDPTPSEAP